MRQIKFRGKRIDTKEWVYGDLCVAQMDNTAAISTNSIGLYEVIPETVGQFTGLILDEGLTPIFEGDIAEIFGVKAVVKWSEKWCGWVFYFDGIEIEELRDMPFYSGTESNAEKAKITGTIHD